MAMRGGFAEALKCFGASAEHRGTSPSGLMYDELFVTPGATAERMSSRVMA